MTYPRASVLVLACALAISTVGRAQSPGTTPSDLVKSPRPLTSQEVTRILQAAHAAMAGKTFRVTYLENTGTSSMWVELQMGPAGRPRYLRELNSWSTSLSDFTGRLAQSCDGGLFTGELVLDYTVINDTIDKRFALSDMFKGWIDNGSGGRMKAAARTIIPDSELLDDVFDMFVGERELFAGTTARVDGRSARAFLAPHILRPGDYSQDPIPPEIQQSLWLDVDSLQLARWEITRSGVSIDYGFVFTPDPTLSMRPPDGLVAPDCIP